jgi:hypothetical protein
MKTYLPRVQWVAMLLSLHAVLGCAGSADDPDDPATVETASPARLGAVAGACIPACSGRACGLDPVCGTSCGTCGPGQTCDGTSGQCATACVPACAGRACGPDPVCGSSCGTCGPGQVCDDSSGQCKAACVPSCAGRACGPDPVCGTSCGTCGAGTACDAAGLCVAHHTPVATIGSPQIGACNPNTGTAAVGLDGSQSYDPDGSALQFVWQAGPIVLASTSTATVLLGVGTHTITLTVRDANGDTNSATVTVTIAKTAPVFTSTIATVRVAVCAANTPVALQVPTALDRCASGPVVVSGVVTAENGSTVSVPVVAGSVVLPAGTSKVHWTATADGVSTASDQLVQVSEKPGLYATSSLVLADGARALRSSGAPSPATNAGALTTSLGVEALLGGITSVAPVILRDRARVLGPITTASTLTKSNGVQITGPISEHASLALPDAPSVPGSISVGTADVILQPGQQVSLTPGAYRKISVAPRSILRLSQGTYTMDALDLEPTATLILKDDGPVNLHVRSSVIFRGTLSDTKNATGNVSLIYLGKQPLYVEAPFFGTLVAPKALVVLRSVAAPHVGSFFAQDIFIDAHAQLTTRPGGCQ